MPKTKKEKFVIKKISIYSVRDRLPHPKGGVVPTPDMLRYDDCYGSDEQPTLIAYLNGKKPTFDRWASFLQDLKFVENASVINPETWFTYVRPEIPGFSLTKEYLKDRTEVGKGIVKIEFKTNPNLNDYK